jgi:sortase A
MRTRDGYFLHSAEVLLWLAAAVMLGVSVFVFAQAHLYQSYLNSKFEESLAPSTGPPLATIPAKPPHPLPMPAANPFSKAAYIGRLQIPRLDVSTMLLEGIDDRTLRLGIGHIPGTAKPGQPGNMGIAGHRDTFFRPLSGLQRNDDIYLQTREAKYHYVVESMRIVEPEAVDVLGDVGHPTLTLVTCYPFSFVGPAPKRFVVQAALLP